LYIKTNKNLEPKARGQKYQICKNILDDILNLEHNNLSWQHLVEFEILMMTIFFKI